MKVVISINSKEASAVNDVLGTFGTELRLSELAKSKNGKFDSSMKGVKTPFGGFAGIVEIPDWLFLGIAQILMTNKNAIKGFVKAFDGICQMADALVNNIRKDFMNMVEDHYNK